MVAMAFSLIVIMLATQAFNNALNTSKVITKSEESNIEGVVGLEVLRHDLEQAGYGLYTDVDSPIPTFSEAAAGTTAASYNDSSAGIPRAILGGDNLNPGNDATVLTGTDYLVIKATTLGNNQAAQKWSYLSYTSASLLGASKTWPSSADNLVDGVDQVVVTRQTYKNGILSRKLIYDIANPSTWAQTFSASGAYASNYKPNVRGVQYYYYGLGSSTPRAPFNRVDYLVKKVPSDMSSSCAPGAGTLYKTVLNQADGTMTSIPLLDCVADMQVALGWNTTGSGGTSVDTYSNADGSTVSSPSGALTSVPMTDPVFIRTSLKLVKVYILAQDGGYDKTFTNTATQFVVGDPTDTTVPSSLVSTINLTASKYQNYRWKLYRIVVRPLNLN